MEDKNPWNGYGKSSFHILSYQMFRCSIICTSLTTWVPRLALPFPLQTMLGYRNTFKTGNVFRGAQTTTLLGGEGERGKN